MLSIRVLQPAQNRARLRPLRPGAVLVLAVMVRVRFTVRSRGSVRQNFVRCQR